MIEYIRKDFVPITLDILTTVRPIRGDLDLIGQVVHDTVQSAKKAIDILEPEDVAPVIHGFNKNEYPTLFECSVCGFFDDDTTTGCNGGYDGNYKYCPNCGAKMDKGE